MRFSSIAKYPFLLASVSIAVATENDLTQYALPMVSQP